MFFGIATVFFAVATIFNLNLLQSNNTGDISLDAIAVMAQAQDGKNSEEGTWVFVAVDYEAECPTDKDRTGVKCTCVLVEDAPPDVRGCTSGSTLYLGCD